MSILYSTQTGKAFFKPKTIKELKDLICDAMEKNGIHCSLNHIDISGLKSLSCLFNRPPTDISANNYFTEEEKEQNNLIPRYMQLYTFDGDISEWNTTNIEDMSFMFNASTFTGKFSNLSKWDISNVLNMERMFAYSCFDNNISNWKINKRCSISYMFWNSGCKLKNQPILLECYNYNM